MLKSNSRERAFNLKKSAFEVQALTTETHCAGSHNQTIITTRLTEPIQQHNTRYLLTKSGEIPHIHFAKYQQGHAEPCNITCSACKNSFPDDKKVT